MTQSEEQPADRFVTLGRITGAFGVKGWLKIFSETDPLQNILKYKEWYLQQGKDWKIHSLEQGQRHGKGLIAKLKGLDDRDQAESLKGTLIAVKRSQLPQTNREGEYYWADLEGLRVKNLQEVELGEISHLFQTGSNDVIVVKGDRERFIPYIWQQVVREVDLKAGLMTVDWDPEF